MFMGYLAAKRAGRDEPGRALIHSFLAGLIVGGLVALLIIVGNLVSLRKVFINASPMLYKLLTFDQGTDAGVFLVLGAGGLGGLMAGGF